MLKNTDKYSVMTTTGVTSTTCYAVPMFSVCNDIEPNGVCYHVVLTDKVNHKPVDEVWRYTKSFRKDNPNYHFSIHWNEIYERFVLVAKLK